MRYFLLRDIPTTEDGDFTEEKFIERYNADLASGLGNLVARVITLAKKFNLRGQPKKANFNFKVSETKARVNNFINNFKLNEALIAIWELISDCDKYINQEKPWSLDATRDKEKLDEVINNLLAVIGEITELLRPFFPETSEKILEQLKSKKLEPLFPRI